MRQPIAVAILDIGLACMSGYDLAAAMRASGSNADARYVAPTGFGQDSDN